MKRLAGSRISPAPEGMRQALASVVASFIGDQARCSSNAQE